ncbi:MAG: hypothetical protein A4S09_10440 [Proteobacteria bacterium SG_bin7]|nr:MAG: hypothetical protein A4S09_10440 [Proteobacteria bacterium SG_bin7]
MKKITKIAFFLSIATLLACHSSPEKAQLSPKVKDELLWRKKQGNVDHIYALVSENGFWNVNHYSIEPGQLQELESHKAFSTEENAEMYLRTFLSKEDIETKKVDAKDLLANNFVTTEVQKEVIWKSENQWSWDWEIKYHEWLKKNFNKNFYIDNKVATDCADGATAIRWIFSRIHKLPAANTLAGSGVVFTNESMKDAWKELPTNEDWRKDKRFIVALDYVLDNTYTHTVFKDGYPIAINKESFLAGTYLLMLQGETGHTMIISYVNNEPKNEVPIRVLSSTGGRIVRPLYESPFWYSVKKGESAILKPRWPIKNGEKFELVPAEKMPHYSLEQFDPNFPGQLKEFNLAVYDRIVPGFKAENLVTDGIDQIFKKIEERAKYVNAGYEFCKKNGCPDGTPEWEEHSTPMRDQQLLEYYNSIEKVVFLVSQMSPNIIDLWNSALSKNIKLNDYTVTLKQLMFTWRYNLYDSNPNVPLNQRWGVASSELIQAFVDRVDRLLAKRSKVVVNNSCKNQCAPDSKEWQDSDSAEFDNSIQRYYIGYIQYCQISNVNCEYFRTVLREKTLTFANRTYNVSTWLERSIWFNSDPRTADDYRWGKLQEIALPIHGLVDNQTIISKNEILMGGKTERRQLYDLKNRKTIDVPAGFAVEDLEATHGIALLIDQNSNKIGAFAPRTQQLISFKISGTPSKVRWQSPNLIAGKTSAGSYFAAKFEGGKFSQVTEFDVYGDEPPRLFYFAQFRPYAGGQELYAPKDIFTISHEKNKYTIYDFSGDELKTTVINHVFRTESPFETLHFVSHVSNSHYLLQVRRQDEKCPNPDQYCGNEKVYSYAVDKVTGNVTAYKFLVGKSLGKNRYVLETQTKKQADQEVYIATLDSTFNIQARDPKIGTAYIYNDNLNGIQLFEGWNSKILKLKDDQTFEEVFKGSQKLNPFLLTETKALIGIENKAGVYNFVTKKMDVEMPWIRAPQMYMTKTSPWYFGGDPTHAGLFRFDDDSYLPIATGATAHLALFQGCGEGLRIPLGAQLDFSEEFHEFENGGGCYSDQNESDGIVFNLVGGRSYYLPPGTRLD